MRLPLPTLAAISLLALAAAAPVQNFAEDVDPEQIGDFFEGDMELELSRNGMITNTRHWPNNIVYFEIDDVFDFDHTIHIRRAMAIIEKVSCIRFLPVKEGITNYVRIIGEPSGCHTKVGYQGKFQTLNLQVDPLDKGCFKIGTIMHEMFHTLGFHHQQSAANRDDYVRVVEENIKPGKEGNFKKYDESTVTDFGVEYDYGSVMHYSSTAFSENGEKTIVPLQSENIEIGQRRELSSSDIAKLNIMYKCPMQN